MAHSVLRPVSLGRDLVQRFALVQRLVTDPLMLGHDLIHRYATERFRLFLTGYLLMYSGAGIVLPLWEYGWVLRSGWLLGIVGVCAAQCVVLVAAMRIALRGRYQQSITLVCFGNWTSALLLTYIAPPLLPVMALLALVPVVFAEPYVRWQRALVFTVITTACVLSLAAVARFHQPTSLTSHATHSIETAFIVIALPTHALHILVIVWNNAAALRTSEKLLSERAAQLAASRTRLITAADEERRRLERDLHDGAQQHLVALAVLIQLARKAQPDRYQPLLAEASGVVENAIAEIRRLAHGIYPPLLVSGGLAAAIPAVAARAPVPVQQNLQGLGRYPASVEAALYYCCSEALQNAAKHGGPGTTVTLTARANERRLSLTITDTGVGFDPATIGNGLSNMTDRLSAIGGRLAIDTAPGRGSRIAAVVPAQALLASPEPAGDNGSPLGLTHARC